MENRHLKLSFFDSFQATLGDKALIHFRSARAQGLFIYLVLVAQKAHRREELAAMFWPEESEKVAKQNLRQSLYLLRKLLGDQDNQRPFLLINRVTVQFNPASNYSLDVADFLIAMEKGELETAVALYQGALLSSFICDSVPFDSWLSHERKQIHQLVLDTLNKLANQSLNEANFTQAQQFARRQLALEPWREEAHRQLMQALASVSERTAALAQYDTCRAALVEELGIEPAPETVELAERIRSSQIAPTTQSPATDGAERHRLKIPFVGRKAEFETLVKAYHQATNDGLQLVTVQGNAGIGKTRLTEQFVTWAAMQGADVLVGRAFETSTGLSYQPLLHLFRQRIERENAPEDLLADLWLSQLTRLLPELRDRYPDLPQPIRDPAIAKHHLFEAITRLGLALAKRRPLVLFIEDWHWADIASLDLLHYAAVRWAEANSPILLILTLRQEALIATPELQSWLKRVKHAAQTTEIELRELSKAETETLVQGLLDSKAEGVPSNDSAQSSLSDFSRWLFKETDGQPLFLTETLKALVEDEVVQPDETSLAGSEQVTSWHIDWSKFDTEGASSRILHGVHELIQGWLERISPQARDLLTAAAVLAQAASFDHLCFVASLEEMEVVEVLDELLGKQLLQEDSLAPTLSSHDPVYSFYHQKVSEVVYSKASAARRRIQHRRAFEALETAKMPAADCAYHALHAGLTAETIRYSLKAGNEAMGLFAPRIATIHYEIAWQVAEQKGWPEAISGADRETLYTGLGKAYKLSVDWPKARDTYRAMIEYARESKATAMECKGLNLLSSVYRDGLNDSIQATALLEESLALAEKSGDIRGMAEAEYKFAMAAIQQQQSHIALPHIERALKLARQLGHPRFLSRCVSVSSMCYTQLRQWEMAKKYVEEAYELFVSTGNLVNAVDAQGGIAFNLKFSGHLQESLTLLEEALAFAQRIENPWRIADMTWKLTIIHMDMGRYDQAIKFAKEGLALSDLAILRAIKLLIQLAWGTVQRGLMMPGAARDTLSELLEQATIQAKTGWITDWVRSELCAVHASADDWESAYKYAKQVLLAIEDESIPPIGLTFWFDIEALLRGGDGDLARAEVERIAGIVGNNRRYQLPLNRSQAVLSQWDGDLAQAIEHLQSTLALAQEMELLGEEWPILGELGKLFAEQGEQENARTAYGEAAVIIRRLAETIDDEGLREGFLTAVSIQAILEKANDLKDGKGAG